MLEWQCFKLLNLFCYIYSNIYLLHLETTQFYSSVCGSEKDSIATTFICRSMLMARNSSQIHQMLRHSKFWFSVLSSTPHLEQKYSVKTRLYYMLLTTQDYPLKTFSLLYSFTHPPEYYQLNVFFFFLTTSPIIVT